MTELDCKHCQDMLPDLLLDTTAPNFAMNAHLDACTACREELSALRATLVLMEDWTAPEPSSFFDKRLYARLREQQSTPVSVRHRLAAWWSAVAVRPAMAGALGIAMLIGGGTAVSLLSKHHSAPAVSSPTVNDLKIYDNNAQALEQMDMLEESPAPAQPQS